MHILGLDDPAMYIDSESSSRMVSLNPARRNYRFIPKIRFVTRGNTLGSPVHTPEYMGSTKRTTIRLTDEREYLLDRAGKVVASGPADNPPNSVVIDAALTHLIESEQNLEDAMETMGPTTVQEFTTSVLDTRYRTSVESRWR